MTNIQKAIAMCESFATGNTDIVENFIAEDYIQHNLQVETGKNAFINFVKYIASLDGETTIKTLRAFDDNEYVVLHNLYKFAGGDEQVAFDVFRFENDLIAEHWDNITGITPPSPSGHTQIDGATEVNDFDKTDENKKFVVAAVTDLLLNKNFDLLPNYMDGDNYIQHNTKIADGASGVLNASDILAKMTYDKIHFVYGKGNFVLTIAEGSFDGVHTSYYDLFRVQDQKLAEHWVVKEPIAEDSKHDNGKF